MIAESREIEQKTIALAIGMSQTGISSVYKSEWPNPETVDKILKYLNISWTEFVRDENQEAADLGISPECLAIARALDTLDKDTRDALIAVFQEAARVFRDLRSPK
jgi:transcriptional regulator with XRE-family HTH domain